jgi:hypothetical protein
VTTKANGNDVDVFGARPDGRLSPGPVVNAGPGTVPFAIAFDPAGHTPQRGDRRLGPRG